MLTEIQRDLVWWINERERIRLKKENRFPPPWTYDPWLRDGYFCNVDREDDRVTRWLRDNWTMDDLTLAEYEASVTVARLFNNENFLSAIGPMEPGQAPEDYAERIMAEVRERKADGRKSWSGAYMVRSNHETVKERYCANIFLKTYAAVDEERLTFETDMTLAEKYRRLVGYYGFGPFFAGQVIADLKNTDYHYLSYADDWWTWSCPGPGSLRGIAKFFGEKPQTSMGQDKWQTKLSTLLLMIYDQIGTASAKHKIQNSQNLQNCLCEYDKYTRVKYGEGRNKRKYRYDKKDQKM